MLKTCAFLFYNKFVIQQKNYLQIDCAPCNVLWHYSSALVPHNCGEEVTVHLRGWEWLVRYSTVLLCNRQWRLFHYGSIRNKSVCVGANLIRPPMRLFWSKLMGVLVLLAVLTTSLGLQVATATCPPTLGKLSLTFVKTSISLFRLQVFTWCTVATASLSTRWSVT